MTTKHERSGRTRTASKKAQIHELPKRTKKLTAEQASKVKGGIGTSLPPKPGLLLPD
jgi:hypothetical protein